MLKPLIPLDETQRLLSLHSMRILDTPSEERFDRITRMAQRMFDVEICLVSLVDAERQWFKSRQGLSACETSREISFCGHAILDQIVFVVEDARNDPRFADNPLVTGEPNIRFYAGCPIRGPNGRRIGTLCIVDSHARELSASDEATLIDFAAMVEDELSVASKVTIDDLTGVANRRGFNMVAEHMLSLCRRKHIDAELVFFDLDGFKQINDVHGHAAGDDLLRRFAGLLIKSFRSADVVARFGGDEFVVLMTSSDACSVAAITRLEALAKQARSEVEVKLAWSVGRVRFDAERHTCLGDLLADADGRMYANKLERRQAG
ncbi:MAG: sensor domain-containing diguanylate cyclase [Gammaproteobacteria bacterium]|nr:sensor domain-containing diguanylate cyclase [Gammaproteobacteria bacterium]